MHYMYNEAFKYYEKCIIKMKLNKGNMIHASEVK